MKQDSSVISRRSMKRPPGYLFQAVGGTLLALLLGSSVVSAAPPAKGPAGTERQPTGPDAKWKVGQEFVLGGNYIEACTDAALCPAHFGANRPGPGCRKAMVFQVTQGRWHNTDLSGLSAAIIAEAPEGETVSPANVERWVRRELWLPEAADSAQADGLTRALGLSVLGAGGPPFSHVERVPLATAVTAKRIFVEVVERLRILLTPATSTNGIHPPDLNNLGLTFRFLGALYVYNVDTLYCAAATPPPTPPDRQSGLTAIFSWSSEAAYAAAAAGKSAGKTSPR